jgi:Flp pilus assembly pilin Flp
MKNRFLSFVYRFLKQKKGAATVELTFFLAFFAPVFFATIIFVHNIISVQIQIEEGVRYAMYYIVTYVDEGPSAVSDMKSQLRQIMTSSDNRRNYLSLNSDRLDINVKPARSFYDYYTVNISYNYPMPPILSPGGKGIDLSSSLSFFAGNKSFYAPDHSIDFGDLWNHMVGIGDLF